MRRGRRSSLRIFATTGFVMALLTKSVTAVLPAALLVILWWQRGRLTWVREVRPLAPWFAVAVASGLLTSWVEQRFIGAAGSEFSLNLLERGLLAGRVVCRGAWAFVSGLPRWSRASNMAACAVRTV